MSCYKCIFAAVGCPMTYGCSQGTEESWKKHLAELRKKKEDGKGKASK
jgi:hypothetical protein